VAPVVLCLTVGIGVLIQTVGADEAGPGLRLNLTFISSKVLQAPLVTVHRSVYVLPPIPENVVLFIPAFAKLPPIPDVIVHNPVPVKGLVALSVTVVNPHVDEPV